VTPPASNLAGGSDLL